MEEIEYEAVDGLGPFHVDRVGAAWNNLHPRVRDSRSGFSEDMQRILCERKELVTVTSHHECWRIDPRELLDRIIRQLRPHPPHLVSELNPPARLGRHQPTDAPRTQQD